MLLEFDAPVVVPLSGLVIGARFDTDADSPACRLAFHALVDRLFTAPTITGGVGDDFKRCLCVRSMPH